MKLESVKASQQFNGRKELIAYLEGKQIHRSGAMAAKCFECMNGYIDGRQDCRIPDCPLYPWMPYKSSENPTTGSPDSPEPQTTIQIPSEP